MTTKTAPRLSPSVITLGCRLNSYESEVMREHAQAAGLGETVIINTCAVTAEAVRTARQTIRRARKDHPEARIVVTGCAAQIDPDEFARWVFPHLFRSRLPRYDEIARLGYTVTSEEVDQVQSDDDFLQLLETAIARQQGGQR